MMAVAIPTNCRLQLLPLPTVRILPPVFREVQLIAHRRGESLLRKVWFWRVLVLPIRPVRTAVFGDGHSDCTPHAVEIDPKWTYCASAIFQCLQANWFSCARTQALKVARGEHIRILCRVSDLESRMVAPVFSRAHILRQLSPDQSVLKNLTTAA